MKHFRSSLKDRTNKNSYSINHNVQASGGGGKGSDGALSCVGSGTGLGRRVECVPSYWAGGRVLTYHHILGSSQLGGNT